MTSDFENNFFGRKPIVELIKKRVIDLKEGYRQNIALLGAKHLGKTSIIQYFLSNLDDPDIIEIYLDLENKDFGYLFNKFAGKILYNFSKSKGLNCFDDLELLMESTKKFIPRTVQAIKKIKVNIHKGKISEAYQELISLPEIFTMESGKFCIIILDEFHHLEGWSIPHVYKELGKKIMTQRKCIYIVTSSQKEQAKNILSEKLSLLFGNFEIEEVKAFDLKTSQSFLNYILKDLAMGSQLKNFLIDFTGGHPFYLSIIGQEIIRLSIIYSQREVFLPLLVQAIENVIFCRWGIIYQHFDMTIQNVCSQKGNKASGAIMISLANGRHKIIEIMDKEGFKKSFLSQRLNRLIDAGIVSRNGNYFFFQDKLLRFWIKYIYQRKIRSIDEDPTRQIKRFREEIQQIYHEFTDISRKALFARIVDLFQEFNNESFHLKGRRYKLPLFRDVVPLKMKSARECKFDVIKACSREGTWFVVLKEESLAEGEVNTFLMESRKFVEKPHRRVIISLSDLDQNVRLKALQEKIWIWNEDELNMLLNLYDKPYIVK